MIHIILGAVDGDISDDSLENDEQDKKLTQSQRDFMGGTYRNEDEYGDDDEVEIDDVYDKKKIINLI